MDWIIFGDDWGRHPSTTQHLAVHFPEADRVVWVNSMGMRSPRLNAADVKRAWRKWTAKPAPASEQPEGWRPDVVVSPRVLPWHRSAPVRAFNRARFGAAMRGLFAERSIESPMVITTYPVPWLYLDFPFQKLAYLKLDEYELLPGVDARLAARFEPPLLHDADVVFVTAKALKTGLDDAVYLPQGVDTRHFSPVPLDPPDTKVLGFFGLMAEWIDWELVDEAARRCPEWTFEFVGPRRMTLDELPRQPNIEWKPAVPYRELPREISHWRAAWAPFRLDALTAGVNPLKVREYLAAGLPTLCTALPEIEGVNPCVEIIRSAEDVEQALARDDSREARQTRRDSVRGDDWAERSRVLRETILGRAPASV